MSRATQTIAQTGCDGDTKPVQQSFYCRCKAVALALPSDLDTGARLLLVFLLAHADDAGGGIYVGTEMLCQLTGMSRRAVYRHMATLASRGLVHADGWKAHTAGARTRQRRLDLDALAASSAAPPAPMPPAPAPARPAPVASANLGTLPAAHSANSGTPHSADLGTQTNRVNQEAYQSIADWRPERRVGPAEARKIAWGEGVRLVAELTGRRDRQARGLVGELLRLAGPRHPGQVIAAMQAAADVRPADAAAYLLAACDPDARPDATGQMRRDWNLGSFGDEAYAAVYGARPGAPARPGRDA